MNAENTDAESDNDPEKGGKVHYYYYLLVDLLGSLLPGTLFLAVSILALVPPMVALIFSLSTESVRQYPAISELATTFLQNSENTPNTIWLFMSLIFFMAAYLLGFTLYRRDPAIPDKESVKYLIYKQKQRFREDIRGGVEISINCSDEDNDVLEERVAIEADIPFLMREWEKNTLACNGLKYSEYPYPYLKQYLKARGHSSLARLITWSSEQQGRSKTFINRIKITLKTFYPIQSRSLIRNEAHIRLASSAWYASRTLFRLCIAGILISLLSLGAAWYRGFISGESEYLSWLIISAKWPVAMGLIAIYCKRAIVRFIHYQRLREIVFVLQMYHIGLHLNEKMRGLSIDNPGTED